MPNLPAETAADPSAAAPLDLSKTLADLGISPDLVDLARAAGWVTPTAVQVAAIPAVLAGADLLALAPTGSGKTAAFLLPMLQSLMADSGWRNERWLRLRALIMAPTRELAAQIADAVRGLAPQLKTVVAVGGVSINPQMMALRGGAHLVIATPGRLLDLIDHNALRLADLRVLVLDEADRLLDLGFADELGRLLALMPRQRQTLMFSATMPDAVAELAAAVLKPDAVRVDVRGHQGATPDIAQRAIEVDAAQRTPLLRHLIAAGNWDQVLVFVATQYASEHVADKLRRSGIAAAALHGQLSQGRRTEVLADFQDHQLRVLVATDLAARGLDIVGLPVVVNHDLPRSADDYTHRIGRTGRADRPGLALSFVCADAPGSEAHFRLIEKRQQLRVAREQVAGFEPAELALPSAPVDANGGVKGKRKSKKDKLREEAAALAAAAARAPRRR